MVEQVEELGEDDGEAARLLDILSKGGNPETAAKEPQVGILLCLFTILYTFFFSFRVVVLVVLVVTNAKAVSRVYCQINFVSQFSLAGRNSPLKIEGLWKMTDGTSEWYKGSLFSTMKNSSLNYLFC